jgi:hypothetical protein
MERCVKSDAGPSKEAKADSDVPNPAVVRGGAPFLLDKNRLNVALSRATTMAIVVGDPRIVNSSFLLAPGTLRSIMLPELIRANGQSPKVNIYLPEGS